MFFIVEGIVLVVFVVDGRLFFEEIFGKFILGFL